MASALIYGTPEGRIVQLCSVDDPGETTYTPKTDTTKIETDEGTIMEARFTDGWWSFRLLHQEGIRVQELPYEYPEMPNNQTEGLLLVGDFKTITFSDYDAGH